ncbi:hypothetical protein FKM82_023268 [Ascaphus truei]
MSGFAVLSETFECARTCFFYLRLPPRAEWDVSTRDTLPQASSPRDTAPRCPDGCAPDTTSQDRSAAPTTAYLNVRRSTAALSRVTFKGGVGAAGLHSVAVPHGTYINAVDGAADQACRGEGGQAQEWTSW